MKKLVFCLAFLVLCGASAFAQPRLITKDKEKDSPPAISPITFQVKYEGGLFGYSKKLEGFLKFDDANLDWFSLIKLIKNNFIFFIKI
jgi:hypothetical protein